jgi:alginate O-acetyltransferase complex protein AlgI
MLFDSFQFFLFFPIVTTFYFVLPHRLRWAWLLIASCYFYMSFIPVYILILIFTIVVDYSAGILIENAEGQRRKLFLVVSLIANIGVLGFFKYFNFFDANLSRAATLLHWNYPIPLLQIILPLGLSFHTFQSMSYTIEVFRGRWKAERHLGTLALYVMFYPQLVAGPIERPYNLLPQLKEPHTFDEQRIADGLKLMAWGFFKKLVIADRLAIFVNQVYGDPTSYSGITLVVATLLFAYQIYCDFSGYSDIAIGSAQVMGFKLMQNFDRPYSSKSVAEFWHRWHISLSTWFRDYVYIPLGGNRVAKWRWSVNIFFVFVISGLWHGAGWTYAAWGALHGSYILLTRWTQGIRSRISSASGLDKFPRLQNSLGVITTFSMVCFAWIFFRATSIHDAFYIVAHLFSGWGTITQAGELSKELFTLGLSQTGFLIAAAAIVLLESIQWLQRRGSIRAMLSTKPVWLRWAVYYGLIVSILLFGTPSPRPFIYFQF